MVFTSLTPFSVLAEGDDGYPFDPYPCLQADIIECTDFICADECAGDCETDEDYGIDEEYDGETYNDNDTENDSKTECDECIECETENDYDFEGFEEYGAFFAADFMPFSAAGTVRWCLSTFMPIQNLSVTTLTSNINPIQRQNSQIHIRIHDGRRYLHTTNRNGDWHGIEIRLPDIPNRAAGDWITVRGRIDGQPPTGARIRIANGGLVETSQLVSEENEFFFYKHNLLLTLGVIF
jgi:hypothetical protein